MTTINLKDFYYWHTQDQFIEVSDEVAAVFLADARYEMAYQRRLSRHKCRKRPLSRKADVLPLLVRPLLIPVSFPGIRAGLPNPPYVRP